MPVSPISVGVIGCGYISDVYLKNLSKKDGVVNLVACADIDIDKAKRKASLFGIDGMSVDRILSDQNIQLIVDLTVPTAHTEINRKILESGKHLYSEKPLALSVQEANLLLKIALQKNVRIGGAPDTFLGGGIKTSIDIIKSQRIGTIVGGSVHMVTPGPESWHPSPEIFYSKGAGPVFDRGPYYLTALVVLLGQVDWVFMEAYSAFTQKTFGAGPHISESFPIGVPTHFTGVLGFKSGISVTVTLSFDVVSTRIRPIELWGTKGSLEVPDPVFFRGPVSWHCLGDQEWTTIQVLDEWNLNCRGIGVIEMAESILAKKPHSASAKLCTHVISIIEAIEESTNTGGKVRVSNVKHTESLLF